MHTYNDYANDKKFMKIVLFSVTVWIKFEKKTVIQLKWENSI
jgi:hypothetical protein